MKTIFSLSPVFIFLLFFSCKKESGKGGNSSIRGNVLQKDCGTSFNDPADCTGHAGADLDIYIIYGDDISYGDKVKTDYEGDFEFKYLRKGSYKIYLYSMDSTLLTNPLTNLPPELALVKEVEITKGKQEVDLGKITTYKAQ